MSKKVKWYSTIMMISFILNLGLYYIAHVYHLPFWMDSVGTAFAAVALEPAAGLLIAFATNFYQAAFIYDSSSLIYYAVSAMAALSFGILLRKDGKADFRRILIASGVYFVSATVLAALITLWRTSGVPDSGWERHFYEMAMGWGAPGALACFFGTAVLKFIDTVILTVLLPVLCKVFSTNKKRF